MNLPAWEPESAACSRLPAEIDDRDLAGLGETGDQEDPAAGRPEGDAEVEEWPEVAAVGVGQPDARIPVGLSARVEQDGDLVVVGRPGGAGAGPEVGDP